MPSAEELDLELDEVRSASPASPVALPKSDACTTPSPHASQYASARERDVDSRSPSRSGSPSPSKRRRDDRSASAPPRPRVRSPPRGPRGYANSNGSPACIAPHRRDNYRDRSPVRFGTSSAQRHAGGRRGDWHPERRGPGMTTKIRISNLPQDDKRVYSKLSAEIEDECGGYKDLELRYKGRGVFLGQALVTFETPDEAKAGRDKMRRKRPDLNIGFWFG